MKAHLMYKVRDFDVTQKPTANHQILIKDLELDTLFGAMAAGDKFLFEVATKAVLFNLTDADSILYRQDILKDTLKNPQIVRQMYRVALDAIEGERRTFFGSYLARSPSYVLSRAIEVLELFVEALKKIRNLASQNVDKFESQGFRVLFETLVCELNDKYFASVDDELRELKFPNGALISSELGKGNKGTNYVLRRQEAKKQNWLGRVFAKGPPGYTYVLNDRDEAGAQAMSELKDTGVNSVADALAQSADHVLNFFGMLRTELAFYLGCLNLYEEIIRRGEPICFPFPCNFGERKYSYEGLYDMCLALKLDHPVTGNSGNADSKDLVIITGANRGGKSTFLRSVGLAQLMMQCGAFVPAETFGSEVCDRLFTHFKREEDPTMKSGKFDEELSRMSEMADQLTHNSMILFNESFAATNEREGSEIAGQIVRALIQKGIKVFFVTHQYEFSRGFYEEGLPDALFLRAERKPDGERTFRIIEGEPLQTSYGEDLYYKIFSEVSRT